MIPASPQTIKQSLNKAYRLIKPKRASMEAFKGNLVHLLNQIDEKESEENVKIHLMDFLKNTFYNPDFLVATKGRTDFVIHTGKEAKTPAGVLFEVKRPTNKADMVTPTNLNAKALHELMLYYLRERLDGHNTDVRQLVITNIYEWFIFDAQDFERLFGKSTQLKKDYEAWKAGQKVSTNTDHFYKEIAKPFLDALPEELPFTYFNIKDFQKALRNENKQDDNQLIGLYKILSPVHLLKLPFTNDSNSLDKGFYAELLHLIGLEEVKEGNKKLIQRKAPARRQAGSLLENAILTIESEDRLRRLNPPSAYGSTEDERLFNVALELCITWINRILFLKLLEAQLIKYHRGSAGYKFLNYATIPQYDELNKLFFQVLARRPQDRTGAIQQKYRHVPYLNSSLFEATELEDDIIRVNSLDDMVELDLHPNTVLRDAKNKPVATSMNALEYLLRFLDAYDFASEGREEIQEESKTLINAAVLGLIFEKINGYKDGSIYTPGFITMYMCRQAIRLAVVQKFNDTYSWQAETFDDLKNYLAEHRNAAKILEFNQLLNSLHICDPAVGSGHFLVSALNELIAIKAELKLLADSKGVRLAGHEVSIENDELIITDRDTLDIFEYTVSPATNGRPFYIDPETQRVQRTIFREKQTIIENCLFGVDINPNSVKICRLRLWIELLKNAYYILEPASHEAKVLATAESKMSPLEGGRGMTNSSAVCYAETPGLREGYAPSNQHDPVLQTLPNIDINIKQGNSLLSRFALDTNLKEALRGTQYTVAQYRSFVKEYKNSHNKERKRELEKIINGIKADFRTEIYRNDPKVKRLQKLTGELQILTTQTSIFEPSAKEKKARKRQQQKLETDIAAISAGIDEIKSNAIYRNAFEWRFEFPEVLDNDGNFVGFDVVIGNPPYIVLQKSIFGEAFLNYVIEKYKTAEYNPNTYTLFTELALNMLLKTAGQFAYIIPNTWLEGKYFTKMREFVASRNITQLLNLKNTAFDEIVETVILIGGNSNFAKQPSLFNYHSSSFVPLEKNIEMGVNPFTSSNSPDFLNRIEKTSQTIKDYALVYRGVETKDNSKWLSENPENDEWKRILLGRDVNRYSYFYSGTYIRFIPKEMKSNANPVLYEKPKILMRRTGNSIIATLDLDKLLALKNLYLIIPSNEENIFAILGQLNSKLFSFLHFIKTSGENKAFAQFAGHYIESFPCRIDNDICPQLAKCVKEINSVKQSDSKAETTALEKQIDELVYQLYDLTLEEIAIVEGDNK